jgi:hypothetical protein
MRTPEPSPEPESELSPEPSPDLIWPEQPVVLIKCDVTIPIFGNPVDSGNTVPRC